MRIWSILLIPMLCASLLFCACRTEEKPRLSAEDQEIADDALATAGEMYDLRKEAVLDESTRQALKQLYIEYGYTRNNTKMAQVYYLPKRIKEAQKYLGGVSDYEPDWARVNQRGDSIEVQLKVNVYGNRHDATEWVKLRQKPDNDEWMQDNEGRWVIVSHQIRM